MGKSLSQSHPKKAVRLVGNYGTGKSHLMSLVSAVAHDAKYLGMVQNKQFAEDAKRIAGKFEVLRIEIGASTMSLRDIILSKIKEDFKARGLVFTYPAQNEIVNNKGILTDMMALFAGKYGEDKGYLVVIDEMLDYLGGRKEQEVKLDFGFLRELGEICTNSRFRIICGVQEQLFDNPNFSFVSDTLNKVHKRFEQMIIQKQDTAYSFSRLWLPIIGSVKKKSERPRLRLGGIVMDMKQAMKERHMVRKYTDKPIPVNIVEKLNERVRENNERYGLSIRLMTNDGSAVPGVIKLILAKGVNNFEERRKISNHG